jgi:hypothetical protein
LMYDMKRDTWTPLTSEGNNLDPTWTADGKEIIYSSADGTRYTLMRVAADGSSPPVPLYEGNWSVPNSVSPDGKFLLFDHKEPDPKATLDIWLLSLDNRKPRPLIATEAEETSSMFSPDGKWIVYLSTIAAKWPPEIYVEPFPPDGQRFHIAAGPTALWSRGGKEIVYLSKHQVTAVDVTTTPHFTVGKPHALFRNPYDELIDVSSDGERFFSIKTDPSEGKSGSRLNVVLGDISALLQRSSG